MKTNKLLIALLLCFLCFNLKALKAQTFHAIIFADTNDSDIGASCGKDLNNMSILFTNISTATGMQLNTIYCSEDECNKETLFDEIRRMQVGSNDVVFFYYTGHGGRAVDEKSPFPQLAFQGNRDSDYYPLAKINDRIKQKNPRLVVSMSDACNSIVSGTTSKGVSKGNSYISKGVSNLYSELFLKTKGNIIVTSSQKGETSIAVDDGGVFSLAFITVLEEFEKRGVNASWQTVMEKTKEATYASLITSKHTPYFEIYLDNDTNTGSMPGYTGTQPTSNDPFIASLIRIASDNEDEGRRIDMSRRALSEFFAASNAIVEVIGRNGTTLLARETAEEFLGRISTSFKLVNFTIIDKQTNENGKITRIKLHEVYKK